MAQVTVSQLAETVGASAERLLAQMKDAGLPHASAEEAVSEEDKQTLLAFLKKSHGEGTGNWQTAPARVEKRRRRVVPVVGFGGGSQRGPRGEPRRREGGRRCPGDPRRHEAEMQDIHEDRRRATPLPSLVLLSRTRAGAAALRVEEASRARRRPREPAGRLARARRPRAGGGLWLQSGVL